MTPHERPVTRRVTTETDRLLVVEVLRQTYAREKGWIIEPESQFPASDLTTSSTVWFLAIMSGEPAGILRIQLDPPIAQYAEYGLKLIDAAFNVEEFLANSRIAEVGRFAVVAKRRSRFTVATSLMRAAFAEVVSRNYTHLVTDVFEDDPHSPLGFHTRIIGFEPIATHEIGELHSPSRRITLLLDLRVSYSRMREHSRWLFQALTAGWTEPMHRQAMG